MDEAPTQAQPALKTAPTQSEGKKAEPFDGLRDGLFLQKRTRRTRRRHDAKRPPLRPRAAEISERLASDSNRRPGARLPGRRAGRPTRQDLTMLALTDDQLSIIMTAAGG